MKSVILSAVAYLSDCRLQLLNNDWDSKQVLSEIIDLTAQTGPQEDPCDGCAANYSNTGQQRLLELETSSDGYQQILDPFASRILAGMPPLISTSAAGVCLPISMTNFVTPQIRCLLPNGPCIFNPLLSSPVVGCESTQLWITDFAPTTPPVTFSYGFSDDHAGNGEISIDGCVDFNACMGQHQFTLTIQGQLMQDFYLYDVTVEWYFNCIPVPNNSNQIYDSFNMVDAINLTYDVGYGYLQEYFFDGTSYSNSNCQTVKYLNFFDSVSLSAANLSTYGITSYDSYFTLSTRDVSLAGQTVTFKREIAVLDGATGLPSDVPIQDFTITFINSDPCGPTVGFPSTIPDVTVSYMGAQTSISFKPFKDSVSMIQGPEFCGSWTYVWNQAALPVQNVNWGQTNATSWFFNWNLGVMSDYTLGIAYTTQMEGYLNGVLKTSAPLKIYFVCKEQTISRDILMASSYTYMMDGTIAYVGLPTYTIFPECGNSVIFPPLPDIPWLKQFNTTNLTFGILPEDCRSVGVHTFTVHVDFPPLAYSDDQTITLTFVSTCYLGCWLDASATYLYGMTTPLMGPIVTQGLSHVFVGANSCGPITWSITSNSFITMTIPDPTLVHDVLIQAQSTSLADPFGQYAISLSGFFTDYPQYQVLVKSFVLTISSCSVTSFTRVSPMQTTATYYVGDPTQTYYFGNYTQTPSCGAGISYSVSVNGKDSKEFDFKVTWLTIDLEKPLYYFEVMQPTDVGQAGIWTIDVTMTDQENLGFSDTQTMILTIINPCPTTTWVPGAVSDVTTTVLASPSAVQTFTRPGSAVNFCCPSPPISFSPSYSWLTKSSNTLTIATTSAADIGNYTVSMTASCPSYPSIGTSTVTFKVTINACVLTSVDATGFGSPFPVQVIIFASYLTRTLNTYIQTPECGYTPTVNLKYDTAPTTTGFIAGSSFVLKPSSVTEAEVSSTDYTMHRKKYTMQQETIFPGQAPQYTTWLYAFNDPCKTTSFVAPTQPFQNVDYSIGGGQLKVTLPILQDTVGNTYSSINNACFTRTITVTSGGQSVTYATVAGNFLTVLTNDITLIGSYQIDALYTLSRYPTVQMTQSFTLNMFVFSAPAEIQSQAYQVADPELTFTSEQFTYLPLLADRQLTHYATLADGSQLPAFISFTNTSSILTFKVVSQANSDAGTYTILLIAQLTATVGQITPIKASLSFQLLVTPYPVIVNQTNTTTVVNVSRAPYFTTLPIAQFTITVGEAWSYTLPDYIDPQGETVTLTASFQKASFFATFKNRTFTVAEGESTDVGSYPFTVNLTNESGKSSITLITLTIIANTTTNSTITSVNITQALPALIAALGQNTTVSNETAFVFFKLYVLASIEDFNWAESFIEALKFAQQSQNILAKANPVPRIHSISNDGKMLIIWDQAMSNPPLSVIMAQQVVVNGELVPALELKLKPGYYSDPMNLTFSYNITAITPLTISLQIYFDVPELISSMEDPDSMEVHFNGYQFFFSHFGRTVSPNTVISRNLPRQYSINGFTARFAAAMESLTITSNVFIVSNFVLNIFLSASLQQLWSMVNTQQIIVLMPMFSVNLPPNAGVFFGFIMQIASFDILPTDGFYDKYFNMTYTEAINENFNSVGLGSKWFLYNIGSMILVLLSIPALFLVILMLKPLRRFSGRINIWHNKLSRYVMWGHPITVMQESYTMIFTCSLINLMNPSYDGWSNILTTAVAIVMLLACLFVPIVLVWVMSKKFTYLGRFKIKNRWGKFYEDLDLTKTKLVILQPAHYFLRRLMLTVVIVCQDYMIVQIMTVVLSFITEVIILGYVHPFAEPLLNKMEYFNEVIILLTLYCFMLFTDLIRDVQTKLDIGWLTCILVGLHLIVNLFAISIGNVRRVFMRIKRALLHRAHYIKRQIAIQQAENRLLKRQSRMQLFRELALERQQAEWVRAEKIRLAELNLARTNEMLQQNNAIRSERLESIRELPEENSVVCPASEPQAVQQLNRSSSSSRDRIQRRIIRITEMEENLRKHPLPHRSMNNLLEDGPSDNNLTFPDRRVNNTKQRRRMYETGIQGRSDHSFSLDL